MSVPVAPVVSGEPFGPGALERLEERFHRYQTGLAPFEIHEAARTIVAEAKRWDLDHDLILAVIRTESAFNTFAVSKVGALGLMQIMPKTGEMLARQFEIEWSPDVLFDPVVNIRMGTRYLAFLYGRYGRWESALAAYNWGPRHIDRRIRSGRALPVLYTQLVMSQLDPRTFKP